MNYEAILLAAGAGKRMKAVKNKVLLELLDKPVLSYSIERFLNDDQCKHLILAVKEDEVAFIKSLIPPSKKEVSVVVGGSERQYSVYYALKKLKGEEAVLVHDGARPFVTEELISDLLVHLENCDAALLGTPVKDTIKVVENGLVEKTIPRETLWQAQTPQAFHQEIFQVAHKRAKDKKFLGTDDTSLLEEFFPQARIEMVMGSYENIKLTTPDDLDKGTLILEARRYDGL